MSHHCHAEGCSVPVHPRYFACRRHWYMVPSWLRDALWRAYRPGQEVDKRVTDLYLVVQTRCRLAIADRERHPSAEWLAPQLAESVREYAHPQDQQRPDREIVELLDTTLKRWVGAST